MFVAETIAALIDESQLNEAMELCFTELTENPGNHEVRLYLAKLFFLQDRIPFAAREIRHLCSRMPENNALQKLLRKLSPDESNRSMGEDTVISETEFSVDDVEILGSK